MLAGLDELIFWLELWHGDPHPEYGMPLQQRMIRARIRARCHLGPNGPPHRS
jgi:hypothetical protein